MFDWRKERETLPLNTFFYKLFEDKTAMIDYIQDFVVESGMSDETVNRSEHLLDGYSKAELMQIILAMIALSQKDLTDESKKRYVDHLNAKIRSGKFGSSALLNKKASKSDDDKRQKLMDLIKNSDPTDKICLTYEEDNLLWSMAKEKDVNNVPSDIFFANTIPLKDIEIKCDETGFIDGGQLCEFRVVVFEDVVNKLSEVNVMETKIVGVLIVGNPFKVKLYIPIGVMGGYDFVAPAAYWWERENTLYENEMSNEMLNAAISEYMTTWYAIQISLLHPRIKTIYENPSKVPICSQTTSKNTKKRKVKFIKVHRIKKNNIEKIIYDDCSKINRKCLCWYVIGHWREYKNGNKIFIKGYWKGLLRDTKRNHDDGRERVIDLEGLKNGICNIKK